MAVTVSTESGSSARLFAGLVRTSIRRMNKIILHGESKVALRAVEP